MELKARDLLVWGVLVAIVLCGTYLRFVDIKNHPAGVTPMEAAYGLEAQQLAGEDWQLGMKSLGNLYSYLIVPTASWLGVGSWQTHALSALIGSLTVLAIYFATRVWFGRLAGLLAAGLLATSHWHLTLSRSGFHDVLLPLLLAAFTAFVGYTIVAVRSEQKSLAFLFAGMAGFIFAAGFWAHGTWSLLLGVILLVVTILLLAALHEKIGFPHVQRYWQQTLLATAVALVVLAPLVIFLSTSPHELLGELPDSTNLPSSMSAAALHIGTQAGEALSGMFAGDGDNNWRHAVAGYPLLNPFVGILFLFGLGWVFGGAVMVARKVFAGEEVHLGMIYPYLLGLIVAYMLPVAVSAQAAPHGLRMAGMIVPIFIIAGTAASVSIYWLRRKLQPASLSAAAIGVVIGVLVAGAGFDLALYFVVARNDAAAYAAHRGDLTAVAQYLNEHQILEQPSLLLVVTDQYSADSLNWQTGVEQGWRRLDPSASRVTSLQAGQKIIFTQQTLTQADQYEQQHDDVRAMMSVRNKFGQEVMRVYESVEETPPPPGEQPSLDA